MANRELLPPSHLGDGVYVHDEGHGLNIAVNHHENKVVFIEPSVLLALVEYARRAKMIK
jgi:hypothetical protein